MWVGQNGVYEQHNSLDSINTQALFYKMDSHQKTKVLYHLFTFQEGQFTQNDLSQKWHEMISVHDVHS